MSELTKTLIGTLFVIDAVVLIVIVSAGYFSVIGYIFLGVLAIGAILFLGFLVGQIFFDDGSGDDQCL